MRINVCRCDQKTVKYLTFSLIVVLSSICWKIFQQLKFVKNYLRSTMSQTRIVDLARLSIESSIARQVDFDSVIRNLANKKARKALT